MQIKLATFNIHHGRGTDGKVNLDRIIKVLEESEADLIGLNEVDRHFSGRSDYMDQISYLASGLQMNQVFGAAITVKSKGTSAVRQYGNALLSRYPIMFQKNHAFDFYSGIIEGRALLEIHLKMNQQTVNIYVTHLSLNPILHRKQTDYILNRVVSDQQPVIVMGDWNMKPGSRAWRKVTECLTDVCQVVGNQPCTTFPSSRPKFQLDYIFVSRNFKVAAADVVKTIPAASDHLPLKATLLLDGNGS